MLIVLLLLSASIAGATVCPLDDGVFNNVDIQCASTNDCIQCGCSITKVVLDAYIKTFGNDTCYDNTTSTFGYCVGDLVFSLVDQGVLNNTMFDNCTNDDISQCTTDSYNEWATINCLSSPPPIDVSPFAQPPPPTPSLDVLPQETSPPPLVVSPQESPPFPDVSPQESPPPPPVVSPQESPPPPIPFPDVSPQESPPHPVPSPVQPVPTALMPPPSPSSGSLTIPNLMAFVLALVTLMLYAYN